MEPDEDEEESWREFPPNEKKVVWQSDRLESEHFDGRKGKGDYCDLVLNFPRNSEDCRESDISRGDLVLTTINFTTNDVKLPVPRKLKVQRVPLKEKTETGKVREKQMLLEDAEGSEMIGNFPKKGEEEYMLTARAVERTDDDIVQAEEADCCSLSSWDTGSTGDVLKEGNTDLPPILAESSQSNTDRRPAFEKESRKPTRNPQCDQANLYSCWKREKSLAEKWQEGERESGKEIEVKDLKENLEMFKEKRVEIMELSDASIKESVVELSLEMKEMEKKVVSNPDQDDDDKDDIERMIKEEMLEGMSVIKVNKMVMDISKLRFTGEKIEDKEESMRRQIECGYCKQKEGKVMTSTDVFQNFSKLKQKYVEEYDEFWWESLVEKIGCRNEAQ